MYTDGSRVQIPNIKVPTGTRPVECFPKTTNWIIMVGLIGLIGLTTTDKTWRLNAGEICSAYYRVLLALNEDVPTPQ
jgi:hypothetical protein